MSFSIKDKHLYLSLVVFSLYFIYRLVDQSKLLRIFPLDKTNDVSSYMTMLHFLSEYGYHQVIPFWQNGFTLFQFYPPGWYYFALPLVKLGGSVLFATFVSLVLIFLIIFLTFIYFGKFWGMSISRRVVFFLFLFANPIAIGNFIRLNRTTELFGWMFFIFLAFLFLRYKDKKLDLKFCILTVIAYFGLMLSHPAIMVVGPILFLCLFLVKKWKERIYLGLSALVSLILSSFWWLFSFVLNLEESTVGQEVIATGLLKFDFQWIWTNIASFVVPLVLFVCFYFYYKGRSKRELLFFSPILVLALLFLFRIIVFVPFLNSVYPDIYLIMFLFFSLFCFLNIKCNLSSKIIKLIVIVLVVVSLVSVGISHFKTPYFEEVLDVRSETIDILDEVEGKLLVPSNMFIPLDKGKVYVPITINALYNYAIIYYGIDTASTAQVFGSTSEEYFEIYSKTRTAFESGDCSEFIEGVKWLNVSDVIAFEDRCNILDSCGFSEVVKKEQVCLYRFENINVY
jgi:hypothetical protein